jgi:L-threonylcarbamoyladenylate synthase
MILDGGPTDVGVESTIVDLSGDRPVLLRPGGISPARLAAALGAPLDAPNATSPRASGTLPSHYAPRTPLDLIAPDDLETCANQRAASGLSVAVVARRNAPPARAGIAWQSIAANAADYARALYAVLRELDAGKYDRILVEEVPESDAWLAVRDRLHRAAYRGVRTED